MVLFRSLLQQAILSTQQVQQHGRKTPDHQATHTINLTPWPLRRKAGKFAESCSAAIYHCCNAAVNFIMQARLPLAGQSVTGKCLLAQCLHPTTITQRTSEQSSLINCRQVND